MQVQRSLARNWGIVSSSRWGILLGAAVLLATLWGFASRAQGAEQRAPAKQAAQAVAVKTAPASTGQVAANLSYTGDVKAVSQVNVLPKASGRIEKLSVEVGTPVKKGDALAELDSASLKAQVAQARANLAAAQAKYAGMESGSREEQIAQARASLDSARQKLSGMQEGSRDEQIAQAQAALDAARARASTVKKGATDAQRQAAQSAVDSARSALQQARARLETVKQWPTQTEWGAALGAVDGARASLASAQARLEDVKAGPKAADIAAAESALVSAKAQVAAAMDLKDMVGTSTGPAAGATSTEKVNRQIIAAEAAVEAAQAKLTLLRSSPQPADLAAAQGAVDGAKASLMAAEFRVDQMKRGAAPEDLRQAEAAVSAAEAQVASAEAALKQIKDGPTEEDLAQAEAAVAQAEQALALVEKPFREQELAQARNGVLAAEAQYKLVLNPFTKNDLDLTRASVAQAQAAVDLAEIALGESVVVSPLEGVVADRFLSEGALIGPSAPIVSVISREVELVLGVEESQIGQLREGQKVEIAVAAYPGELFPARVVVIAPAADPKSRTFQVKVRPEDKEGKLRPGMFAQVKVVTQEKERVVLVPKEAVVNRSGQTSVFVLKGDAVEMRQVRLGLTGSGGVEVLSGVEAGEEVVVAGQNDLRDGDKVRKS